MGAALTYGCNGNGAKWSDSGHILKVGTIGLPERMDMEHIRKISTKDACKVWGPKGRVGGLPLPETGQTSVEHMWGKQRALGCGCPHGGREEGAGCRHLGQVEQCGLQGKCGRRCKPGGTLEVSEDLWGGVQLVHFHGDQSQGRGTGGRCYEGVTGEKGRHQESMGAQKPSVDSGKSEDQLWLPWLGPREQPGTSRRVQRRESHMTLTRTARSHNQYVAKPGSEPRTLQLQSTPTPSLRCTHQRGTGTWNTNKGPLPGTQ